MVAPSDKKEPLNATGNRSIISLDQMQDRHVTLEDVLEREAGVRIRRFGGDGADSTVSIRGSNAGQVNVFLDGIPLNNAAMGEVNLSTINARGIDRIEIRRSGDSVGSPVGGSIHLFSAKSRETPEGTRLAASGGSYHTGSFTAEKWGGKDVTADVSARVETSRQDFRYRNDNGTPVINSMDDHNDVRRNADYKSGFATARAGFRVGKTDVRILNDTAARDGGLPGSTARQTFRTRQETMRNTTGLSTDTKGVGFENLRLQSRFFFTEVQTSFRDPDQEYDPATPNSFSRLRDYGFHLEPTLYLLDWHQTLRAFLGTERQGFWKERRDKHDKMTERLPTRTRVQQTARLDDELTFFKERLIFTLAGEYQDFTDRFPDPTTSTNRTTLTDRDPGFSHRSVPNFSGGLRIVMLRENGMDIFLRGLAATGSRIPLFVEIFGQAGSIIGNPNLKPERSTTAEIGPGVKVKRKQLEGEAQFVVFDRTVKDMILFVPNSQFSLHPENVDRARISGAETALSGRSSALHMQGFLNYTYQRAFNESDIRYVKGKLLPYQPMHDLAFGLGFFNEHFETGAEASYRGAIYRDRTNDPFNYQPGYWLYGLYFRWIVFGRSEKQKDLRISLDIKNVQNRWVTETAGYPLPGRAAYLTVSYRF